MAYGCTGSTRIGMFSSPLLMYGDSSTGTATADNVRVLQQSRSIVANFLVTDATVAAPTLAQGENCSNCY
jgi:hypothetical protein